MRIVLLFIACSRARALSDEDFRRKISFPRLSGTMILAPHAGHSVSSPIISKDASISVLHDLQTKFVKMSSFFIGVIFSLSVNKEGIDFHRSSGHRFFVLLRSISCFDGGGCRGGFCGACHRRAINRFYSRNGKPEKNSRNNHNDANAPYHWRNLE